MRSLGNPLQGNRDLSPQRFGESDLFRIALSTSPKLSLRPAQTLPLNADDPKSLEILGPSLKGLVQCEVLAWFLLSQFGKMRDQPSLGGR